MKTTEHEDQTLELDDEGYLASFDRWSEEVACAMAEREGVTGRCPMTAEAIDILRYMREYYQTFNSFPVVLSVCKRVHQPRGCICDQFPDALTAWKIAGLPKPSAGVLAHLRRHPRLKVA